MRLARCVYCVVLSLVVLLFIPNQVSAQNKKCDSRLYCPEEGNNKEVKEYHCDHKNECRLNCDSDKDCPEELPKCGLIRGWTTFFPKGRHKTCSKKCSKDEECPGNLNCFEGFCGTCHDRCPSNHHCIDGKRCVPYCDKDKKPCADGKECICSADNSEHLMCTRAGFKGFMKLRSLGLCKECENAVDCPNGLPCTEGVCMQPTKIAPWSSCKEIGDCSKGFTCSAGTCVPFCNVDTECKLRGTCITQLCKTNSDCKSGKCDIKPGQAAGDCKNEDGRNVSICVLACSPTETCPNGSQCLTFLEKKKFCFPTPAKKTPSVESLPELEQEKSKSDAGVVDVKEKDSSEEAGAGCQSAPFSGSWLLGFLLVFLVIRRK